MHRYIPYLAKNAGFKKIGEKVVHHQARKYGTTKFGLNRFVNGYLDLLSLWFLSRFGIKPMHFSCSTLTGYPTDAEASYAKAIEIAKKSVNTDKFKVYSLSFMEGETLSDNLFLISVKLVHHNGLMIPPVTAADRAQFLVRQGEAFLTNYPYGCGSQLVQYGSV